MAASAQHSSTAVPAAGGAARTDGAIPLRPRQSRSEPKEEKMRVISQTELMHLSRTELMYFSARSRAISRAFRQIQPSFATRT